MSALVVRPAAAADLRARSELLTAAHRDTQWDAFLYFFFQEVTLQAVVLLAAVLFIFCGVSAPGCALLLPAAAAAVLLAVRAHHLLYVTALPNKLRGELAGWVAEYRGPLQRPGAALRVSQEPQLDAGDGPQHRQVIGTLSVWWERGSGGCAARLGLLCVSARVRRRGCARALLAAARGHALQAGLQQLHAATSQLQPAARALLHDLGWECRGTYHRPLLGDALTLPMAHLTLSLPHA